MHPFSLKQENTKDVTGGNRDEFVLNPIDPVWPPKDLPSTQAVGEEGGLPVDPSW